MSDETAFSTWAKVLDEATERQVRALQLPKVSVLAKQIRVLLEDHADIHTGNNVFRLLRYIEPDRSGKAAILLGPTFDKGPAETHFRFREGARLSFSLGLHEEGDRSRLVAYRYHLELPLGCAPAYFRIDLNEASPEFRFREPRSHWHPGRDHVRIPHPALGPVEMLSRLFEQIEPHYRR